MGGLEAGSSTVGEGLPAHLGMGHTSDEGIARPGSVDDTGGNGFEVLVASTVTAINALAAQCDIDLGNAHFSEAVGSGFDRITGSDSQRLYLVEFHAMQAFCLALLQCLDDTGSLSRAHGIDQERSRAVIDEILQGPGRDIGIGNHTFRTIDVGDACCQKLGGDVINDIGVGHSGNHVACLVVDAQVQTIAHTLAAFTQTEVHADCLALAPAHLAEGLATECTHKLHIVAHEPQVVGDVTRHAATAQGHLTRHRVGRDKRSRQSRRNVHVHTTNNSYKSVHHFSRYHFPSKNKSGWSKRIAQQVSLWPSPSNTRLL